jgi:hypothetical protein
VSCLGCLVIGIARRAAQQVQGAGKGAAGVVILQQITVLVPAAIGGTLVGREAVGKAALGQGGGVQMVHHREGLGLAQTRGGGVELVHQCEGLRVP